MISIALSKGRILDETLPLLKAAGIVASENPETSRKLIIATSRGDVRLIIVRASDVPTYVQYGAADLGIAGGDVLAEHGGSGLYQPLDLKLARCRLMVAVRRGFDYKQAVRRRAAARGDQIRADGARAFRREGRARRSHQALWLDGAGAADRACRRHRGSGFQRQHARANNLMAVEEIFAISSARLIVNQAAFKLKRADPAAARCLRCRSGQG